MANLVEILVEARENAGRAIREASSSMDRLGDAARRARVPLAITFGAITAGAGLAVKAASDLEEATNKANVTFGESAEIVQDFAKVSAQQFGISARAANEYAGTLGTILNASGLARTASADMSVELVKLAADLASFNNIPIDVALEKLRSGLVGEVEPLRTVGVLLSQAAVESKAVELGLIAVGDTMTEQEKVQARYALIMEQTAVQQGDFQRTSDSLANQLRILQSSMEDLASEIGVVLLPAVQSAVGGLTQFVGVMKELPDAFTIVGVALVGLVGAFAAIGLALPPVLTGLGAVSAAVIAIGGLSAGPLGILIVGLGALVAILYEVATGHDEVVISTDEHRAAIERLNSVIGDASQAMETEEITSVRLRKSLAELQQQTKETAQTVAGEWVFALDEAGKETLKFIAYTEEMTKAQERARNEAKEREQLVTETFAAANLLSIPKTAVEAAVQALAELLGSSDEAWRVYHSRLRGLAAGTINDFADQLLFGIDITELFEDRSTKSLNAIGEAAKDTTETVRTLIKEQERAVLLMSGQFGQSNPLSAISDVLQGISTTAFGGMLGAHLGVVGGESLAQFQSLLAGSSGLTERERQQNAAALIGELNINLSGVDTTDPEALAREITRAIDRYLADLARQDEQSRSS